MAIIGVLSAIALLYLSEYRRRAFDAKVQSTLRNYLIAQEAYLADTGRYLDCRIDNGASTCGALGGIGGIDTTGFSGVQFQLENGLLMALCNTKAPHGFAFVNDTAHRFYTGGRIELINLSGPCSIDLFPAGP